jgi:hypothetical protein
MSDAQRIDGKHLYAYYWKTPRGYVFHHWLIQEADHWWKVDNDATGWSERLKWDGDTDTTKVRAGKQPTWVVGPITDEASVMVAFRRVGIL